MEPIMRNVMDEALVSVIIPTYKRSDYLPRAIDSVLKQTYNNIEIIVVDDNGDGTEYQKATEYRLKEYIESRKITYIKHPVNRNGSAARNTGFKNCKGEFVNYLDDDDIFLADKIERQVAILKETDNVVGGAYTPVCYLVKSRDGIVKEVPFLYKKEGDLCEDFLVGDARFNTSGLLFKRDAIESLAGFDESYRRHQDFELMIRFFEKYTLKCASSFPLYYMDYTSDGSHGIEPMKSFEFEKDFLCKFEAALRRKKCFHKVSHILYYQCSFKQYLAGYYSYGFRSMCYSLKHGLFTVNELVIIFKAIIKSFIRKEK